MIEAKFLCVLNGRKSYHGQPPKVSGVLEMQAVMAATGEDSAFGKATPTGKLSVELASKSLTSVCEPGQKYYLALVPLTEDFKPRDWTARAHANEAFVAGIWKVTHRSTHERGSSRQWDITLNPVADHCEGLFDTPYPCAALTMTVMNPEAARQLQAGHEFQLILVRAKEAVLAAA